jgi:hypothetical protein
MRAISARCHVTRLRDGSWVKTHEDITERQRAEDDRDRNRQLIARLAHTARLVRPADIDLAFLAHADGQAREAVRAQPALAQRADAVHDGVRASAGRIRLQPDTCGLPARAKVLQDGAGGELSVQRAHEAAEWHFDHVESAGEALGRS